MTEEEPRAHVSAVLREVMADNWDDGLVLSSDTSLLYDLDLESMELVVLADQLQQRFPQFRLLDAMQAGEVVDTAELTLGSLAALMVAVPEDDTPG